MLFLPLVASGKPPFDAPYNSLTGGYSARFKETRGVSTKSFGTKLQITDRVDKTIFIDSIPDEVAVGARWTDDGKFLIIPTTNGDGSSPWHVNIYLFSISHHALRYLDDSAGPPIISSEIWSQPPDTIILVGHDFSHGVEAPNDPILVRYKARELWKKLKKD